MTGSPIFTDGLLAVREAIASGRSATLEEALSATALFEPLVLGFIARPQAGSVPAMLVKVAEYYEQDVEALLAAIPAVVQTIVTLGLAPSSAPSSTSSTFRSPPSPVQSTRRLPVIDTAAARRLEAQRGFTLIELMVVVSIIALIATIIIPNFIHARQEAQVATSEANLKQIADLARTILCR